MEKQELVILRKGECSWDFVDETLLFLQDVVFLLTLEQSFELLFFGPCSSFPLAFSILPSNSGRKSKATSGSINKRGGTS